MTDVILAHTEEAAAALPLPAFVYAIIAASAFLALGVVTFSYRDVAGRHRQKWAQNAGHDSHGEHDTHGAHH
jgi:hypothetical protein